MKNVQNVYRLLTSVLPAPSPNPCQNNSVKIHPNVAYSPSTKGALLDIFTPEGNDPSPTLIMLHGGGWISGDKSSFHDEASFFASQGIACACVAYRLAPLHPFPAACDDVLAATKFLRDNAKEFNLDPKRLIAFGNSAGGHLSCIAGLQQHDSKGNPTENVDGVITICPITDIRNPNETQYPISMSFLEQFMDCSYSQFPDKYANASPITHIHENAPPFLIFHGDSDDIVPPEQSKSLYVHLCQAGIPAEYHSLPEEGHSFTMESWLHIRELSLEFVRTL
jgi:acetyl esterase/lipase